MIATLYSRTKLTVPYLIEDLLGNNQIFSHGEELILVIPSRASGEELVSGEDQVRIR